MSDKHAYEAYGIRAEDGHSFTVEVIGEETRDEAVRLAGHYADLWRRAVDLYRVPFIRTNSAAWAPDEIAFVCRVWPRRTA